jgi:hypothetical protein
MEQNHLLDVGELVKALHLVLEAIERNETDSALKYLRFTKGIVNVSDAFEHRAKAYLTAIFAELHMLIDARYSDSDTMYDYFIRAMTYIYGSDHVVILFCILAVLI